MPLCYAMSVCIADWQRRQYRIYFTNADYNEECEITKTQLHKSEFFVRS
jgi:hypothetical protein